MDQIKAWMSKNEFLLRRLHSLSGVIPIGFFLIEHLFTNSMAFFGPEKFNEHVHWLHNLPYLAALEIGTIFLPLLYHGIYGLYIARTGRPNSTAYPYMDNWRYTLQRVTGYIAFIFIMVHLAHFRFAWLFGGTEYVNTPDPFELTHQGFVGMANIPAIAISVTYLIATAAAVFHFCNGLTTFCITWGITVGDTARRRLSAGFAVLGLIMFSWGAMSIWAFMTYEEPDAALVVQTEPNTHEAATP